MSTSRLAYDDAVTLAEMAGDAHAVELHLHLPQQHADRSEAARVLHGTPYISDSLASHAADLELHLA